MNSEINRLHTFSRWPASAPVDPARLARGGFFYTGEGTEVQCFSCNAKISNWNYGDQVMSRHRNLEPQCTFIAHQSLSGNVPINNIPSSPSWGVEGQEQRAEETDTATRPTSDYGLTEEDEMYRSDALRLLSFINWEDASVSREALVNAGFYHAGAGRLRCAWCGGELAPYNNLGTLGSPLEIHRMYFPRCDHAATIMASLQSASLPISSSPFETPPIRSPVASDEPQSSGAAHNSRILSAGTTWRALGVVSGGAKHPAFSSLASRSSSFRNWPADRTQTPLALAEAGFFHTGTDDQVDEVRCFYCDGGLGKWESGDAPWSEHARWFPSCGYVLLVKGQEFVDSCERPAVQATAATESRVPRRNTDLPVTEELVNACLENSVGMGALSAGLDAARVRRAITRRLRTCGYPFTTPEALIDAVLDEQLNEEAWSVNTNSQRFARDILAETLQEFVPRYFRRSTRPDVESGNSQSDSTRSPSPTITRKPEQTHNRSSSQNRSPASISRCQRNSRNSSPGQTSIQNRSRALNGSADGAGNGSTSNGCQGNDTELSKSPRNCEIECDVADLQISLEEENRQLKESRMCKVCMDSEVSVVFLPCGHLVSCARCGAALPACPLCRAPVKALVRAYLA